MPNIPDSPYQLLANSSQPICNTCSAISELERDISNAHDNLKPQDLSENLISLKISRNLSHDRLASQMPVELVSRIFTLIDTPDEFFDRDSNRPFPIDVCVPALLSRICTRWRKIALATPQLWTNVYLNLQKHSLNLDITKEWLLRSGSLPLNMWLCEGSDNDGTPSSDLIDLIRSHSTRWEYLNFKDIGSSVLYKLFHNLEDIPSSEYLDLRISIHRTETTIFLQAPLRPRQFHSQGLELVKNMPFRWNNLMNLEVNDTHISDVLPIVEQAPNLRSWSSYDINTHSNHMTNTHDQKPLKPTVHRSLKTLNLSTHCRHDINIFQSLTLPSLEYLSCIIGHRGSLQPDELVFDSLIDFVERSELRTGSLSTFQLRYHPSMELDLDRSRFFELASLTHLHMEIPGVDMLSKFLSRFSDIRIFPHLQSLKIDGFVYLDPRSWDILCDFVVEQNAIIKAVTPILDAKKSWHPGGENNNVPFASILVQRPPIRPLKTIGLLDFQNYSLRMKKQTFLRLREAQRDGPIDLKVGYQRTNFNLLAEDLQLMEEQDIFILFKDPP